MSRTVATLVKNVTKQIVAKNNSKSAVFANDRSFAASEVAAKAA
jgi:hypothetical protein